MADGHAQSPPYASASFVDDWQGLSPVWMESVPPRRSLSTNTSWRDNSLNVTSARMQSTPNNSLLNGSDTSEFSLDKKDEGRFPAVDRTGDVSTNECRRRQCPGRERFSTPANSRSLRRRYEHSNDVMSAANTLRGLPHRLPSLFGGGRAFLLGDGRVLPEMSPASSKVPLENADTFLLVGDEGGLLGKTSRWLEHALPGAAVLGGLSSCALVIKDKVCGLCA